MAEQKIQIANFYETKSILRAWNFEVDFSNMTKINSYISKFHVIDVTIPSWNFKQNTIKYGSVPKSYTTLESDHSYNFKMTLEDDDMAKVTQLVYNLHSTIIDQYGVYYPLNYQLLGDCIVRMYNQSQQNVIIWKMENCRFLGADDWTLNYTNTEAFKIILSFSCDNMSYEQPDDLFTVEEQYAKNEISYLGLDTTPKEEQGPEFPVSRKMDNTYDYPKEHDNVNFRQNEPPKELRKKHVDRGTYFRF